MSCEIGVAGAFCGWVFWASKSSRFHDEYRSSTWDEKLGPTHTFRILVINQFLYIIIPSWISAGWYWRKAVRVCFIGLEVKLGGLCDGVSYLRVATRNEPRQSLIVCFDLHFRYASVTCNVFYSFICQYVQATLSFGANLYTCLQCCYWMGIAFAGLWPFCRSTP